MFLNFLTVVPLDIASVSLHLNDLIMYYIVTRRMNNVKRDYDSSTTPLLTGHALFTWSVCSWCLEKSIITSAA